jgi:hypothetical protein
MAKLTIGKMVYEGPIDLTEFTVIKYVLTDINITDNKSAKVGPLFFSLIN